MSGVTGDGAVLKYPIAVNWYAPLAGAVADVGLTVTDWAVRVADVPQARAIAARVKSRNEKRRGPRQFMASLLLGDYNAARKTGASQVDAGSKGDRRQDQAAVGPVSDLWDLEEYLTQRRKEIDHKYNYRYSQLTQVFGRLLYETRVSEEELRGFREDKLTTIRSLAKFLAEDAAS